MRRVLTLLLVLIFFVSVFGVARAVTISGSFGGRVTQSEAAKVEAKTTAGFVCEIEGQTFDIKPAGRFPTGPYLVSFAQLTKAGVGTLRAGQLVLGRYGRKKVPIATCTNEEGVTIIVYGYKATLQFGASKT